MGYQSLAFLIFSSIAICVFYISGVLSPRLQKYTLLVFSIYFYCVSGLKYLPYLVITLLFSYFSAYFIGRIYSKTDELIKSADSSSDKKILRAKAKNKAKGFMFIGISAPLILLILCKYTGFIEEILSGIFKGFKLPDIQIFNLILPLGISFYTFMAVGYVLDVFWKRIEYERNFFTYACFLTYFPHIVQGPIDRYGDFKKQFSGKDQIKLDTKNLTYGAELVIWGFFKKLVIADRIGLFVNTIYDSPGNAKGIIVALATVMYSIQIYADFSGCIDIVSGVSEMMGIKLAKNFNNPYFAKTIPEFWRRWHISLSEWFKDFVYFPVSTSRLVKRIKKHYRKQGKKRIENIYATCIPTVIVWSITGLWHGASWNFVVWGVYYAILMVLGNIFSEPIDNLLKKCKINTGNFLYKFFQMLRTFLLCTIGRIFFRTSTLNDAGIIIKSILVKWNFKDLCSTDVFNFGLDHHNVIALVVFLLILLVFDIINEKTDFRDMLSKRFIIIRWFIILSGIFAVIIFGIYGPGFEASNFIYEKF